MQLCDLTLQYDGVRVLEHLNLTLPDSGLVCIFAPSGTGKTTLLNLFCGLLKPDSGRVEGLEDRKFAYVFQEDRLVPQLTARENIRLVMEQPDEQWICQMIEQLGLAGWEDALPQELSGGMQQRVGIAAAMLLSPGVLLADEPTSALDVTLQKQVVEEMRMVRDTFGTAIVLVAHNLGVIGAMADNVLVLKDGKTVEYGKTGDILTNPQADYTKALLAAVPRLRR